MDTAITAMAIVQQSKKNSATEIDKVKQLWLDKLWSVLFDDHSAGLMSPGQIRRERRNRQQVRQLEMEAILQAEADINGIHQGTKALDDMGNLIDTPLVEAVHTHRVIENTAIEQGLDLGAESSASMIRSAVKEVSVRDLERSLNIRKLAILAESEILHAADRPVSRQPVNAEWMMRWRENAENVFHAEAQLLWARMLVLELARPGSYALGTVSALRQLSHDDLQVLRIGAKYAFPLFIYDARGYFKRDTHNHWFEVMEDLGLMNHSSAMTDLSEQVDDEGCLYLACGNRAIRVSAFPPGQAVQVPVFKLTRIGKQLLPLLESDADLAYMFELGRMLKSAGCGVEIGEWHTVGTIDRGTFVSRMVL